MATIQAAAAKTAHTRPKTPNCTRGGWGRFLLDMRHVRGDCRMIASAIRKRRITQAKADALVKRAVDLLERLDQDVHQRHIIAILRLEMAYLEHYRDLPE